MAHPVEAYAVRVEAAGRSLTYSGDTAPTDALVALARDTDVLLCEASFLDGEGPPGLHLTGREAGEHAAKAGAGRLLVTHVPPWVDADRVAAEAAAAFPGAELVGPDRGYEV
jgi:ribonuclease BN (tRNA processing enzyme)